MADTDLHPEPTAPAAPPRPSWETNARPAPRPARAVPPPRPAALPRPLAAAPPPPSAPLQTAAPDTVRYDLAGNPIGDSGPRPSVYAPPPGAPVPPPYGYSAGPSSPAVWPPALMGGGAIAYRNNSGEQGDVPAEIAGKRWHWGAFFFPIMWLRRHNMTAQAGLISGALIVPRVLHNYAPAPFGGLLIAAGLLAYWVVRIYFGWSGHKFAWRNRHFPDGVSQYFKVQQAWMLWGIGIFALDIALQIFVLGALFIGAGAAQSGGTYSSSGYTHRSYSRSYHSNRSAPSSEDTDTQTAAP